jgi:hypothetical protein
MYEVHYSDGADHAGVGRFETWKDARRFADCLRSCGYTAVIHDLLNNINYPAFDYDVTFGKDGSELNA